MSPENSHRYLVTTTWTGNRGSGTAGYGGYSRDHEIEGESKRSVIPGSSVPAYRGDAARYNPEDLLVASLSACHMLWFLHLCVDANVVATAYRDVAEGTMRVNADGSGEFTEVVLHPSVELQDESRRHLLPALHERAHDLCFIARSVNFPVRCEPS